jgi:hypothetical protein
MVTAFCTAIAIVTVAILAVRLTVFSDRAAPPESSGPAAEAQREDSPLEGGSDFPYSLNANIFFPDSTSAGSVTVINPETNEYLLSVNIILPDTKVSLYYNGSVAPGETVSAAKLSAAGQRLINGTYHCVAEISARDPETLKTVASEEKPVTVQIG